MTKAGVGQPLAELLAEGRALGFLGPGPIEDQIIRSLAFCVVAPAPPHTAVDLGSGAGLPGLALALAWPQSHWALVDSNHRRSTWLAGTVSRLGLAPRCAVICGRAETVGRGPLRHTVDLVVARSFAAPGPTAECAAPLLMEGGYLLVAEPPTEDGPPIREAPPAQDVGELAERPTGPAGTSGRWPVDGLTKLGMRLEATCVVRTEAGPTTLSRLVAASECPGAYPRRVGIPFKRRLF